MKTVLLSLSALAALALAPNDANAQVVIVGSTTVVQGSGLQSSFSRARTASVRGVRFRGRFGSSFGSSFGTFSSTVTSFGSGVRSTRVQPTVIVVPAPFVVSPRTATPAVVPGRTVARPFRSGPAVTKVVTTTKVKANGTTVVKTRPVAAKAKATAAKGKKVAGRRR